MTRQSRLELIRVGGAIAIPGILLDLGADENSILRSAGLSTAMLADPDNVIPLQAAGRLIRECVAATSCEHFGLLVGQRASTSSLGLMGLLVEHSPDVRTALDNLIRYQDSPGVAFLEVANGTISLSYRIVENSISSAHVIIDSEIATLFNIMRRLCGSSWRPVEVMLPRPRPQNSKPFDSFFKIPLRFGARHGVIVFSSDWLIHPVDGANAVIRKLIEDRIVVLGGTLVASVETQLRRFVKTLVLERRCSLETVAQLFTMELRTLSRRLEQEGIKFRKLADEVRYEVARDLLADTSLSMMEVSAVLDYTAASSFTRAFHRWSVMTPTSWRADQLRSPSTTACPRLSHQREPWRWQPPLADAKHLLGTSTAKDKDEMLLPRNIRGAYRQP